MAEWEQFNQMVENNSDQVLELAVAGFVNGISSQPLVCAMRENKVEQLILTLPKINEQDEEFKIWYMQVQTDLINMLVGSYNNPKPNVPMSQEEIITQAIQITKRRK